MNIFNTRKKVSIIFLLIVLGLLGYYLYEKNIGTINIPNKVSLEEASDLDENNNVVDTDNDTSTTDDELSKVESLPGFTLPAGFALRIFAKNVPDARVIEMDPKGRILVSQTGEGKITAFTNNDGDAESDDRKVLASGLNNPHGLAFKCDASTQGEKCFLYVAESDALSRYLYDAEALSLGKKEKLMSMATSSSGGHFTRSLLFLPSPNENVLLVSVGSSCNVCDEKDNDRASVLSYNVTTGKKAVYAKGLRNATFMALNPVSGKAYATEMGRDNLGDNIPPDEVNILEKNKNYGWPVCYGKNIHDEEFDKKVYIRNPCMEPFETPSFVDLQAHSAPLGLSFVLEEGWPEEYRYDLLVAYHGSWNRSVPTGYKIVRLKMSASGKYSGTEDFITGWLKTDGSKTGRPVDIKVFSRGVAYISDDSAGVVYKLFRTK